MIQAKLGPEIHSTLTYMIQEISLEMPLLFTDMIQEISLEMPLLFFYVPYSRMDWLDELLTVYSFIN